MRWEITFTYADQSGSEDSAPRESRSARSFWTAILAATLLIGGISRAFAEPLTLEALEGRIKQVETDPTLEESAKKELLDLYKAAIHDFHQAEEFAKEANKIREKLRETSKDLQVTRSKREQLDQQPSRPVIPDSMSLDELEKLLDTKRDDLEDPRHGLRQQLEDLDTRAASRAVRLQEIPGEIAAVDARLEEVQAQLAKPAPEEEPKAVTSSRRLVLNVQKHRLEQELAALQGERDWTQSKESDELLREQRELLRHQIQMATATLEHLTDLLDSRRQAEAEKRLKEAEQAALHAHPLLKPLANRNKELAEDDRALAEEMHHVSDLREAAEKETDRIREQSKLVSEMIQKVGQTESVGLMLRKQRTLLLDQHELRARIGLRPDEIRRVRMKMFELETALASMADKKATLSRTLDEVLSEESSNLPRATLSKEAEALLKTQRELIEELRSDYNSYGDDLINLDLQERKLLSETKKFAAFIDERILWIRTNGWFGWSQLAALPKGVSFWTNSKAWRKVQTTIASDFQRNSWIYAAAVVGLLLGFAGRGRAQRLWRRVEDGPESDPSAGKSFVSTIAAILATGFLAAIGPAVLMFFAWRLRESYSSDLFTRGVMLGLWNAAILLFPLEFLRLSCSPSGVGDQHLGWSGERTQRLRRQLGWFLPIAVPLIFCVAATEAVSNESLLDSLGRALHLVCMLATAFFAWRATSLNSTVKSTRNSLPRNYARGLVLLPIGLVLLTFFGYAYSSLQLTWRLIQTGWLALGLVVTSRLVNRWIRAEKHRLTEWQAHLESESNPTVESPLNSDALPRNRWAAWGLSPDQMIGQLRRLSRMMLLIGGVVIGWAIWSDVIPAFGAFERIPLWHVTVEEQELKTNEAGESKVEIFKGMKPVTLGNLCAAILILSLGFFAGRNIPGFLETVLLERLPVDTGLRFAISVLVHYSIVVLGIVLACAQIRVGWSNVQWLVAAASVGLGFGLQEIFSNFVSGIILLFERPMRVGDTVTVSGTTGTVTKIRIRATTITDGDRKELIVPNREFITGSVLNWTLSDTINRIAIKVVVNYDSDPEKVRKILLDAAAAHPDLLKTPPPSATLEEFGTSTLTFMLRGFLPDLAERLKVAHDLNSAIVRRLQQGGIQSIPMATASATAPLPTPTTTVNTSLNVALEKAGLAR